MRVRFSSAARALLAQAPSRTAAFAGAVFITAVALSFRWSLQPVLGEQAPFLVLLTAPVVAAAWGGFAPGLLATVLCTFVGSLLFVGPIGTLVPPDAAEWTRLGSFFSEGALFSWLFGERRHAIAAAERRERRFRDAVEAAPSGMILANAQGRIAFANARARQWFGYSAGEFAKLWIEDLVPPAHRDSHGRERTAFSRAPTPRAMGIGRELRARRKDGSEFPVEIGLGPVESEGESLVLAAVVDVTERQKALTSLVESERRQRYLLALTETLQALDEPGAMIDAATRALGEYLGAAQVGYGEIDEAQAHVIVERDWNDGRIGSVVGQWRMDDFGPACVRDLKAGRSVPIADVTLDSRTSLPAVLSAYQGIATRSILDVPLIRNGRMASMVFVHHPEPREWSPDEVQLAEETCVRLWTAVERVRADRRAGVLLELLDRAGDAARVGAFVDTLDGPASLRWSDRMFDIMGVPRGQTPTRTEAFDRFPSAVRSIQREALERMMREGEPLELELPLLPHPSAASWVRIYIVPTMREGKCVEISGAVQDISDRKQLELDVVAATNQERTRIGEDLHDDLGQVLTAVTLHVGAFRRSLGAQVSPAQQRQDIETIERNLEHARTVCRRLARAYVAPVSSLTFLAMLRQLARDVPDTRECLIQGQDLPAETPSAVAQELFRIAQEALNNALRHSGGTRIVMGLQADAARLTLSVEDDGVGMPDDPVATGVGFTSMRSRAARIGGILTVKPGERGGTRVVVTCARAEVAARAMSA